MSDKDNSERIAKALERIADALDTLVPTVQNIEDGGGNGDPPPGP